MPKKSSQLRGVARPNRMLVKLDGPFDGRGRTNCHPSRLTAMRENQGAKSFLLELPIPVRVLDYFEHNRVLRNGGDDSIKLGRQGSPGRANAANPARQRRLQLFHFRAA